MVSSAPEPGTSSPLGRTERLLLVMIITTAVVLALHAASGESPTFDEPSHLAAGASHLFENDFRLADHPPLGRIVLALPLLAIRPFWATTEIAGWREGDIRSFGDAWLEKSGEASRLVTSGRIMNVLLMALLLLVVFAVTRRLFGNGAALVATTVLALDPTLLSHGHLVTTDLALALAVLLAILTFQWLVLEITAARIAIFATAVALLFLIKLSGLFLLPALLAGIIAALFGRHSIGVRLGSRSWTLDSVRRKISGFGIVGVIVLAFVWIAIWASYGFRFSPFRSIDAANAMMETASDPGRPKPESWPEAWSTVLNDPRTGQRRPGLATTAIEAARDHRLLPEAYLYGAAYVRKKGTLRASYLRGEHSMQGWPSYFPIAFLVKTPIPTLLLFAFGLLAIVTGAAAPHDRATFTVIALFFVLYWIIIIRSPLALGIRHLLPVIPLVALTAGASCSLATSRIRHGILAALLAALAGTTLRSHPRELAYFNEASGGMERGHEWLADSNLDWGQDLDRLAAWANGRGEDRVILARFGPRVLPKGLPARLLVPDSAEGEFPPLEPGTYIVSATVLVGVYVPIARESTWTNPAIRARFAQLDALFRGLPAETSRPTGGRREWEELRRGLLISRLRRRPPDERIGSSLFVFRLDSAELDRLISP